MARFVAGDVVVVPFPFSDLSQVKRRPALVVAAMQGDDLILCQITSQARQDQYAIALTADDFGSGKLNQDSFIRPNKIFTLDQNAIAYQVGRLRPEKLEAVLDALVSS